MSHEDSGVVEMTGKVMIGTIVALFVVLIFVFLLHLYAKWFWYHRQQAIDGPQNHHHHQRQHHHLGVTILRRGVEPSFLETIQVVQFHSKDFQDRMECAICLLELEEGEKARILPKCGHAFHTECIDMWFHSHSTCPICRDHVSQQTKISVGTLLEDHETNTANSHNFPTNVLFWGDETEVSTSTSQLEEASSSSSSSRPDLVIDIPSQTREDEDRKSPVSSRITTSLMRILSSNARFNPFSPSSRGQS